MKAPSHFSIIWIYRYIQANPMHDSRIIWYRIFYFHFICPPIRECRSVCTMSFHFIGHFITFKYMRKRIVFITQFIGNIHGTIDLALYVWVTGNVTLFIQNFHQSIQFQVAAGSIDSFFALVGFIKFPFLFILFGPCKCIDQNLVYTHAGIRIAVITLWWRRSFNIFSQCKFDLAGPIFKFQFIIVSTPS